MKKIVSIAARAALVGLGVGLVASAVFIGAYVGDEDNPANPALTLSILVSFPLGTGLSWLTRLPRWWLVAMAGPIAAVSWCVVLVPVAPFFGLGELGQIAGMLTLGSTLGYAAVALVGSTTAR
ncbi:hypothetical protein ABZ912_22985 [Nonomuraea angiospora]|uniref:hypothetical protein n=1 Tax=Nonomuraea angiospora TaxID=46172 RepID=UPI0033C6091F